jgi:hypothetical protein
MTRRHPPSHTGDHAPRIDGPPAPQAAPPQPKGVGSLRVLKTMHRNWVTAGGVSIYGPVVLPPRQH